MRLVYLKRISESKDTTYGVIIEDDVPLALTIELPWCDNRHNESCIPPGEYLCKRESRPKHGEVFTLIGVPDRTDILIHKGNISSDSNGCIILAGGPYGMTKDKWGAQNSAIAFDAFMRSMYAENEFKLVITN